MNRKSLGIVALSISAALLLSACIFEPAGAQNAGFAVKDRDYQLITTPSSTGGDSLTILDNRTGRMAVFIYDMNSRSVRPAAVRDVADAFK